MHDCPTVGEGGRERGRGEGGMKDEGGLQGS